MKLVRFRVAGQPPRVGALEHGRVQPLSAGKLSLCDLLHGPAPLELARKLLGSSVEAAYPLEQVQLLAPIDEQEVWAAGVTYRRSQIARMEESEVAASHYDRVYTADRPELFFKATPDRVAHPLEPIRIRSDSNWTVPEPELAVIVDPAARVVGYTIGNDVSARDIEGENPLYLPQAKMYRQCCALGPCVLLHDGSLDLRAARIELEILREDRAVFSDATDLNQMHRSIEELVSWLARENEFPQGVVLLTGTGIVPPDDFTLLDGDVVAIRIDGIGELVNPVVKATPADCG